MTITIHNKKTLFVIQIHPNPPEYLYYVGGDWGPNHSGTTDISEALNFPTYVDAKNYLLKHWSSDPDPEIEILKVEFEEIKTYKPVDSAPVKVYTGRRAYTYKT